MKSSYNIYVSHIIPHYLPIIGNYGEIWKNFRVWLIFQNIILNFCRMLL